MISFVLIKMYTCVYFNKHKIKKGDDFSSPDKLAVIFFRICVRNIVR